MYSQSCGKEDKPYDNILNIGENRWLAVGLSTFNLFAKSDWKFYFDEIGCSEVALVHSVWRRAVDEKSPQELALLFFSEGVQKIVLERVDGDEEHFVLLLADLASHGYLQNENPNGNSDGIFGAKFSEFTKKDVKESMNGVREDNGRDNDSHSPSSHLHLHTHINTYTHAHNQNTRTHTHAHAHTLIRLRYNNRR